MVQLALVFLKNNWNLIIIRRILFTILKKCLIMPVNKRYSNNLNLWLIVYLMGKMSVFLLMDRQAAAKLIQCKATTKIWVLFREVLKDCLTKSMLLSLIIGTFQSKYNVYKSIMMILEIYLEKRKMELILLKLILLIKLIIY